MQNKLIITFKKMIKSGKSAFREFPTPPQGGNTANFRTIPPRLQGEMRERAEGEGEGKGRGEEKGRDPQGLVDTPMFQILNNTLSALIISTSPTTKMSCMLKHFWSRVSAEVEQLCL